MGSRCKAHHTFVLPLPWLLDSTPLGNDSRNLTHKKHSPPRDPAFYSVWFYSISFTQPWLLPFFTAHCGSSRLWGLCYLTGTFLATPSGDAVQGRARSTRQETCLLTNQQWWEHRGRWQVTVGRRKLQRHRVMCFGTGPLCDVHCKHVMFHCNREKTSVLQKFTDCLPHSRHGYRGEPGKHGL